MIIILISDSFQMFFFVIYDINQTFLTVLVIFSRLFADIYRDKMNIWEGNKEINIISQSGVM